MPPQRNEIGMNYNKPFFDSLASRVLFWPCFFSEKKKKKKEYKRIEIKYKSPSSIGIIWRPSGMNSILNFLSLSLRIVRKSFVSPFVWARCLCISRRDLFISESSPLLRFLRWRRSEPRREDAEEEQNRSRLLRAVVVHGMIESGR